MPVNSTMLEFPLKGILVFSTELDLANVEDVLARLSRLGFDTIFYVAKNYDGHVMFDSKSGSVEKEMLGPICKAAEKFGIRVIAWICTFTEGYVGELAAHGISDFIRANPATAAVDRYGRSTLSHPVRCDHGLENYVCPANPLVLEHTVDLMKEIVCGYPVQGVHLDFVRFPYPGDYCYCGICQRRFYEDTGLDLLNALPQVHLKWKQAVITDFVTQSYCRVKDANPEASISALVWRYPDCFEKTQAPHSWPADFLTPMLHHRYYMKAPGWIKGEALASSQHFGHRIVASIGGTASRRISRPEWMEARRLALASNADGYLVSHYGLRDVLDILEAETFLESANKYLRWGIYRGLRKLKESVVAG